MLKRLEPIDVRNLFEPLHGELLALLQGLEAKDWLKATVAGSWRVRDVAAHLLDVDLRTISGLRDGHREPPDVPVDTWEGLVGWLNRLNAEWVCAAGRLSPRVLTQLLVETGPEVAALYSALPLHEPSLVSVAWAGEIRSANWMHVGREYTERWHHQMQIRDAVDAPGLLQRRWLHPLLNLSVRALPRAYGGIAAPEGTVVTLEIRGEVGEAWSLVRAREGWEVLEGHGPHPTTIVRLDEDSSWRLFYHALTPDQARESARVTGDAALAEPLFRARSVMV